MFAKVIIDNPFLSKAGPLSYSIPKELEAEIEVGSIVIAPFRNQKATGVILEILDDKLCDLPNLKPILSLSDFSLQEWQIKTAKWISDYYMCPLYKAIKLFLPTNFWKGNVENKKEFSLIPATSSQEIKDYIKKNKRFIKQVSLLKSLLENKLLKSSDFEKSTIKSLEKKGMLRLVPLEKIDNQRIRDAKLEKFKLSENQKAIFKKISESDKKIHLLHGLSSSGKTEIYLHLALEATKRGKQVLILTPELTLTHHLVPYFKAFFPQSFAVLHSKVSAGKRRKIWHQIYEGHINVVVGSRISLFYPYKNLDLIIVDESHEWSYKSDKAPRYQTREVATSLPSILENSPKILLGTATPSIETYNKTITTPGWQLHSLEKDFNEFKTTTKIADMREEFHRGNKSIFSEALQGQIRTRLQNKEQSLIIVNRRGFASSVSCRDCGQTSDCSICLTPYTLYKSEKGQRLFCHHCAKNEEYHTACTACGSISIKELGIGTQKVVKEAKKEFPEAKILQVDGSTMKSTKSLNELNANLENADIIIGTQIAAKGFDLKKVTLSCVLLADLELNFPDYGSSEKAYQLFIQTRGRAGRHQDGLFIIQTYQPEHPVVMGAAANPLTQRTYEKFYLEEIQMRKTLTLPPFSKLARLNVKHDDEKTAEQNVKNAMDKLNKYVSERDHQAIHSAPDLIYRKQGRYNWHILLQADNPQEIIKEAAPKDCIIDINPSSTI